MFIAEKVIFSSKLPFAALAIEEMKLEIDSVLTSFLPVMVWKIAPEAKTAFIAEESEFRIPSKKAFIGAFTASSVCAKVVILKENKVSKSKVFISSIGYFAAINKMGYNV